MAQGSKKRYPRLAIFLSLSIQLAGLWLVFSGIAPLYLFAWVLIDVFLSGHKLRDVFRLLLSIFPLALAVFFVTVIVEQDGRVILGGLASAEGLKGGFKAGSRVLVLAVFARNCLVRFGLAPMIVILSYLLWPLRVFRVGHRLAARTVYRSILLVPVSFSRVAESIGIKKNVLRSEAQYISHARRDYFYPLLLGLASFCTALGMLIVFYGKIYF